ncbi:MAG: hypothetical protein WC627_05565 [Legionella sp.]|jgi:hypothetical protein
MLVEKVLAFIGECQKSGRISDIDKTCLKGLLAHLSNKNPKKILDATDIQAIVACYKSRWSTDKQTDCTLNTNEINDKWIEFAKELCLFLATETAKPLADEFTKQLTQDCEKSLPADIDKRYLYLLIPVARNSVDFNTVTVLQHRQVENPDQFYLGSDGVTLYKKQCLAELAKDNAFTLATRRQLQKTTLSPVSIEELARMKLGASTEPFIFDDFQYDNFWDFLYRKVFACLQSNNPMPQNLLPFFRELVILIDLYFDLKSKNGDLKIFKEAFKAFAAEIARRKLTYVNYFYGMVIQDKTSRAYLLEYLIDMHSAETFSIDNKLIKLATWMYQVDNAFKSSRPELKDIYTCAPASGIIVNTNIGTPICDASAHPCWSLIVSLFVVPFTTYIFFDSSIIFWDQIHDVQEIGASIYRKLSKYINTKNVADNNSSQIEASYDAIIKDLVNPAIANTDGFFNYWLRQTSTINWLRNVQSKTLDKLGVYWFEPELYLAAFYKFNSQNPTLDKEIKLFLDKLIHTYTQNKNDSSKRIRVNILFAKLIKEFSPEDIQRLLISLHMYKLKDAQDNFSINCVKYISRRLADKASYPSTEVNPFLTYMSISKPYTVLSAKQKSVPFKDIIDCFVAKVNASRTCFERGALRAMTGYLSVLSGSIKSVDERLDTSDSSPSEQSYLGVT